MHDEAELAGWTASLRAGRREAWDRLYALTHLPLLRMLRRLLRDDARAEDALQATYVTAIERVGSYDDARGPVDAWLSGIARHKAQEALRASRERGLPAGAADPAAPAADAGPDAGLVALALDLLDPRYAEVLRRKYLAGEAIGAIAAGLGLNANTVGTLLQRGRERFRQAFERLKARAGV
jgi:RNA polymerase sigma-70 factor (ECF subfamily)